MRYRSIISIVLLLVLSPVTWAQKQSTPVIVVSDLYIPAQDAGDNLDILTPYALDEIDLKGVIFDVTERFRKIDPVHGGPREPGFIAIHQLNYIFNKNVPAACGPFTQMRSPDDKMEYAPAFQLQGFELFFDLLENSEEKIEVVSTGSARFLAVAYNRNPELMKNKISNIHLCAGASSSKYLEWNVELDPSAMYRLLQSDLPITLYPCATEKGAFDLGKNNSFWALYDMDFVIDMNPLLKRYIHYSLLGKKVVSYLYYIDSPLSVEDKEAFKQYNKGKNYGPGGKHYVWETAIWLNISKRKLIRDSEGEVKIVTPDKIPDDATISAEEFRPCIVKASPDGLFSFNYCKEGQSNIKIYFRANPQQNQEWLNEALPELYKNFTINH